VIERVDKRLRLEDEIRQRLKGVCGDLTSEDFQSLVEQIAGNSIKSDERMCQFRLRPVPR
jgi:hypothetical protein